MCFRLFLSLRIHCCFLRNVFRLLCGRNSAGCRRVIYHIDKVLRVFRQVKAGFVGCVYHSMATDTVETVDDENACFFVLGLVCGKDFGREAFTTPVYCRYFERIDDAGFIFRVWKGLLTRTPLSKSASSDACIDNVFAGCGSRFQRVIHSLPGKFQGIFLLTEADGEIVDR